MSDDTALAEFIFETGMLAHTPRSGFAFLGSGQQSVAAHSHRMALIGLALARLDGEADACRVMMICLVHDLPEARTSDLNHLTRQYNQTDETAAIADMCHNLPIGAELRTLIEEYENNETREAGLAHDADQLELIAALKEQQDTGNRRAADWLADAKERLATRAGQRLAQTIAATDSAQWWMRLTNRNYQRRALEGE
jgi:putative hydrolase of HD superfamily